MGERSEGEMKEENKLPVRRPLLLMDRMEIERS